ncbi:hypothetical protein [Luteimonas sp. FCS-9]|uniref:hypothetical protein n=1 Tax=Luteimonas sp. FCS-9 TaxID=1547516 RepID=UPI0012E00D81|nr:hypothetical protein [Luteimonas sp. FCS-9]
MKTDDVELCRIYGQMAREYLGAVPWEDCASRLEAGWLRLRRNEALEWEDAEPLIRAFWELAD